MPSYKNRLIILKIEVEKLRREPSILQTISGVILIEAADINILNRSLEDSVKLGRSEASDFRSSVVGVSARFREMFEREMDSTIDYL